MRALAGMALGIVILSGFGCAKFAGNGVAYPNAYTTSRVDFEQAKIGMTPVGWTAEVTGEGEPSVWVIREDKTSGSGSKVLRQKTANPSNRRFPVCVMDDFAAKDVEVSTRFKPITGKVDQCAGIIVRYQDKDNYYIARANGLEDNVRLYKVVKGTRIEFAGVDHPAPAANEWHSFALKVADNQFTVSLNNKILFEASDSERTFIQPGKIGLWTKADSVTEFDNVMIRKYN